MRRITKDMLEIWDERLSELSYSIYIYRKEFIDKIKKIYNITNCIL